MALNVTSLEITDVKVITPPRHADDRGFLCEVYNRDLFSASGIDANFIQDNQSLSITKGTVRGLHYQAPPFAQAKLVRVLKGAIVDVAVDIRKASPTYGHWVKTELTAENGNQVFVPKGFLHGFATLQPETEILYKVDNPYSREHSGSVCWSDPTLNIAWGLHPSAATLSDQDKTASIFAEFISPF